MRKNHWHDDPEHAEAVAIIKSAMRAARESIPLVVVMAATAETLVEATLALLDADLEAHGNTTMSMEASMGLVKLVRKMIEEYAATLNAPTARRDVH